MLLRPLTWKILPPLKNHPYSTRSEFVLHELKCHSDSFINSFYPDSVRCWNRLGHVLRDSPNLQSFKKCLLARYRPPAPRSIFGIHDSLGIRRLFQLRVGLSPLLGRKSTQIPWYPFRQEIKNNPKIFFSFIKSKKCENIGVSPLRYSKGKLHTDDKVKANLLNRQFISVFSNDDAITPTMLSTRIPNMPEITVTINGVTKLLEKLIPYKASGPDMVSARFLKEVATEISPALTSKALYQQTGKKHLSTQSTRKERTTEESQKIIAQFR